MIAWVRLWLSGGLCNFLDLLELAWGSLFALSLGFSFGAFFLCGFSLAFAFPCLALSRTFLGLPFLLDFAFHPELFTAGERLMLWHWKAFGGELRFILQGCKIDIR